MIQILKIEDINFDNYIYHLRQQTLPESESKVDYYTNRLTKAILMVITNDTEKVFIQISPWSEFDIAMALLDLYKYKKTV